MPNASYSLAQLTNIQILRHRIRRTTHDSPIGQGRLFIAVSSLTATDRLPTILQPNVEPSPETRLYCCACLCLGLRRKQRRRNGSIFHPVVVCRTMNRLLVANLVYQRCDLRNRWFKPSRRNMQRSTTLFHLLLLSLLFFLLIPLLLSTSIELFYSSIIRNRGTHYLLPDFDS